MSDAPIVLELTNFRLAGFLVARGLKLAGPTFKRRNQTVYPFDDTSGIATKLATEYVDSAEQRYDVACTTMHQLIR